MAVRQDSLATTLAKRVVQAMVRFGLTQDDVLKGAIKHDNLAWQIPPLVCEATLDGVPLSSYFEASLTSTKPEELYAMWSDALMCLRNSPDKVLTPEGYRATSYVMPLVRTNERQLFFALPEGYPGGVTDYVGVMFSLECAHLMRYTARHEGFVEDEDNYYAKLAGGLEIGIKDGLPVLCADEWDLPVHGMVQEMLRMPRGSVWEGCDYNIISKVRSVTHDLGTRIREPEGIDWALQALRVIDGDKELLTAVRDMRAVAHVSTLRVNLLREAWQIATQLSITDRQRVAALKQMLVPEVMSSGQFSKAIYPYHAMPPAMLKDSVLQRLQSGVKQMLDEEERHHGPQQ